MIRANTVSSVNISVNELNTLKSRINELQARIEAQANTKILAKALSIINLVPVKVRLLA